MVEIEIKFKCPKCRFPTKAALKSIPKYFLYCCPVCKSNVIFYDNKMDVLSDNMVKFLTQTKRLKLCGKAFAQAKKVPDRGCFTKDQLIDLRILIETSKDSKDFISKI